MKTLFQKNAALLISPIVLGLLGLLSSCEVYRFETPQPIDVVNEVEFPKEFHGRWSMGKVGEVLVIRKNSVRMSGYDSAKVVNKIAGISDSLHNSRYLKYIHLNKTTRQLDTVVNYIVRGNKIYKKEDGLLAGAPFVKKKDTLFFRIETVLEFELDSKAILRKINNRRFVLNIHEERLVGLTGGKGPFHPWWQVMLLELSPNNKLLIRDITSLSRKDPSMFYSDGSDYYFDAAWTKVDIVKFIDQGYFKTNPDSLNRIGKP